MTIRSGLAWSIALAILGLMTVVAAPANAQSAAYTISNASPGLVSGGNFYMPSTQRCLSQWCAADSPVGAITCKAEYGYSSIQHSVECPTPQKWGCVTTAEGSSYCQVDVTPEASSCYYNVDPYKCGALLPSTVVCAGVQQCSGYVGNCPSGQTDAAGNCVKKPGDPQSGIPGPPLHDQCDGALGMCVPNASKMLTSLKLNDTPLTYQPPFGPWLALRLTYNHLDTTQPAAPNYFNFGPQWTARFLTFIQDDPATGQQGKSVLRYVSGGGAIDYAYEAGAFNTTTGAWAGEIVGAGVLKRIPATGAVTSYTFTLPDGTVQTYGKLDGASTWPRRVFLTQVTDPQGNTLTLTYDATLRLTALIDASGRSTTLSYTNANPKLVTRLTDPFGRHADFTYDGAGRMASITDAVGITSSFAWDDASGGDPTFIKTLTTPYGGGSFHGGRDVTANTRWLELTDALGQTERLEYLPSGAPGIAANVTTAPAGMATENGQYDKTNSFFWDKHSYPLYGTGPGRDYTKAEITHWALNGKGYASPVTASVKQPLENRVYYSYPGQTGTARYVGTLALPAAQGRVLDDATSSVTKATYNALGYPLTTTDAMGRVTRYTYAANNIDVTLVEQKTTASVYTTVAAYGGYNTKHEPQTYTDAAGQVWSTAYNAAGQVIYTTDPLNETRFWEYDAYGRVARVTIPTVVAFASVVYGTTNTSVPTATSYTYDAYDRVRTNTDSAGYVTTYDYDALDHVTRITYPDGSHDDSDYTFQSGPNIGQASLDLRKFTDRLGRITTYDYDANRRLTSVTEPVTSLPSTTRTTSYSYYENGALKDQTDANGNVTHYAIDLQGRPTTKTYAYGTAGAKTETTAYETTTSRMKSLTDALAQVKTYAYALDNRLTGIAYTGAVNPTPNVTIAYDAYWPRKTGMTDGTGTTSFTYSAPGTNGALKLATIDNASYANDTITNSYDALGRLSARAIAGGNEAFAYDTLGRMQTHTTGLGTFTYGYLGQTGQVTSRTLNGTSIATSWAYDTNTADRRPTTITNSGATRSYGLSFIIPGGGGASSPYDIKWTP